MDTLTPDPLQARVSAAVRLSHRTGRQWADLLEVSPQALSDRLRHRTAWTLADAAAIAGALEVSLDALIGPDDLPIGYVVVRDDAAALERERHPGADVLEGERL